MKNSRPNNMYRVSQPFGCFASYTKSLKNEEITYLHN
jgi:hypothetical protein